MARPLSAWMPALSKIELPRTVALTPMTATPAYPRLYATMFPSPEPTPPIVVFEEFTPTRIPQ